MSGSVEQELSLISSKTALSARQSRALSFCRVGTIGFAAVLVVFALSHVAAEAKLSAQSKDRAGQPAKDPHTQPAQSRDRHGQPAQSKDRPGQPAKDLHTQPAQSKDRPGQPAKGLHTEPAQSKDRPGQPAKDLHTQPTQSKERPGQPPKDVHTQPAQSKERHGQPAQSKDLHTQPTQSKDRPGQPAQSKDRHAQPVQAKDHHAHPAQSKDRHAQPAQSKDRHTQPAKSKDRDAQRAADRHSVHRPSPSRLLHGPDFNPPYADILVDDNSGQVLHETNPDSPRHPASLTKIMTLYLLFEQLEAKKFNLDSRLQVSAHAAAQAPTKLGLKPNETITVEDAIKAIVTRSANDAAVVIAEAIAGSESDFAALMTREAQMLGMVNTVYVNASGLPADAQITTAREQALLGRAIQERFSEYSHYFAIPCFQYHGIEISNHNALLREMQGVDGIKTGYTEASGYNLVASMRRDGRHLIGVVLGERSNGARDARMRKLIEDHLSKAALTRTAPSIVPAIQDHSPQETYNAMKTKAGLGSAGP
jgi:D-alanyl-D-alanine carboxypeptidase